jgi:hypothetical protein
VVSLSRGSLERNGDFPKLGCDRGNLSAQISALKGNQRVPRRMLRGVTIADITLAAFTLCNSLRVVAYLPQIARAARDRSGAEAISFGTWGLFLVSHTSAMAYALVNQRDWTMALVFLGNAAGCGAILLIAAWKRSRHRRQLIEMASRGPCQKEVKR